MELPFSSVEFSESSLHFGGELTPVYAAVRQLGYLAFVFSFKAALAASDLCTMPLITGSSSCL